MLNKRHYLFKGAAKHAGQCLLKERGEGGFGSTGRR